MAQGGLPKPSTVHVVSSTKGRGVRELLADLQAAVGMRGDVWVVGAQVRPALQGLLGAGRAAWRQRRGQRLLLPGRWPSALSPAPCRPAPQAQNAGKSSLINAMRGTARLKRDKDVTTAPLPGTTLGMLRVPGLLPTGCKMLDTPGVPHAYQVGVLGVAPGPAGRLPPARPVG